MAREDAEALEDREDRRLISRAVFSSDGALAEVCAHGLPVLVLQAIGKVDLADHRG